MDPGEGSALQTTLQSQYHLVENPGELEVRFSPGELDLLEMLTRAYRDHLPLLDSLVVPDRVSEALLTTPPFRVRWGPVSTARAEHPTPSGRHALTWRSRGRHSTVNPEWYMEWYFNFHNERGLSFHQYALPGYPASHACARLLERDAQWLFEWGESWELDDRGWAVLEEGTPVWILGKYDFDAPPPWLDPEDPHPPLEVALP